MSKRKLREIGNDLKGVALGLTTEAAALLGRDEPAAEVLLGMAGETCELRRKVDELADALDDEAF